MGFVITSCPASRTNRFSKVEVGNPTSTDGEVAAVATLAEAADRVGLHRSTVAAAKKLVREAPPSIVKLVEAGDMTISGAQDVIEFATPT